jgi:hypothetical protein
MGASGIYFEGLLDVSTNKNGYTVAAWINQKGDTIQLYLTYVDISSSFEWSFFPKTVPLNFNFPFSIFVNKRNIVSLATNLNSNTNGNFFSETNIFATPVVETVNSPLLQPVVDGKGNINILMQNSNGVEVATYRAVPVINSVTPNTGPVAGGTQVTITGVRFNLLGSNPKVFFGSKKATKVVVVSDTEMTAVSPAAKQIGSVHIRARAKVNGERIGSPVTDQDLFTYTN